MAKVEDCPGFETFGEDVRAAWEALGLTIKALAEQINIDPQYLSEIELKPTIPSIPVILQLVRVCRLPIERYFNPELVGEDSAQRQRVSQKLKLCPEKYLPIVEAKVSRDNRTITFSVKSKDRLIDLLPRKCLSMMSRQIFAYFVLTFCQRNLF